MLEIIQRIATKALITREDGRFIILREASTYNEGTIEGKWHLPGGRLEIGENYQDGLLREVKEETRLEIKIFNPIYVGEWRPVIKGVQNQIVAIFFYCTTDTDKVILSDEHDAYRWVNPQESKKYDIMENDYRVIENLKISK